jgi:hypothetical protein
MITLQEHPVRPLPVANYSVAIAKAVEWLGDRYLLAKPIRHAHGEESPPAAQPIPRTRLRSTV